MARRRTTVDTHFKPSLGRYVPTYQREQEHADHTEATLVDTPPKEALLGIVNDNGAPKPLTFPLAAYKPPKRSWWERRKASVKGSVRVVSEEGTEKRWWSYMTINRRGEGYMYADSVYIEGRWWKTMCRHGQRIGPNQSISGRVLLSHQDYSNTNMPELESSGDIKDVSWAGANLRNAKFTQSEPRYASRMEKVIFDGADLEGAKFLAVEWSEVSLRGANVTDVDFSIKPLRLRRFLSTEEEYEFVADLTDSNVTEKQFEQILANIQVATNWVDLPGQPSELVRIRRYTPQEFTAVTGIDKDELTVLLWCGDIQYRSKATDMPDEAEFDYELHYIPQWEAQRIIQEKAQPTPA